MKIVFPDGSFMLAWDKCRAWFNPDGTLKYAEYKRLRKGVPISVAIPAGHKNVRAWLSRRGAAVAELIEADKEYDAAKRAHDFATRSDYAGGGWSEHIERIRDATRRLREAKKRRATALSRIGGAA